MLNSLVCLAAQSSRELAKIEGFVPIKDPAIQATFKDDPEQDCFWVTSVKDPAFQKLAKQ
jgi:hypothetical protein